MFKKILKWFGIVVCAIIIALVAFSWRTLGKKPSGDRLRRIVQSPEWVGQGFENPQPLKNDKLAAVAAIFSASEYVTPHAPVSVIHPTRADLTSASASGLSVVWMGHAMTLVEIDGFRVLTDPIFSERASPLQWLGPRRWYAPPVKFENLPPVDVVVVSHDHYDHLDMASVQMLATRGTKFVVPLGIGANLEYWGIAPQQIIELDWWQEAKITNNTQSLRIAMTPARHVSGRYGFDNAKKLWAGYALIGAKHRVYFSGDTGLFNAMKDIGRKYGPFDLTMIEVGQYNRAWPDRHIGPEQAVKAHQWVKGRVMLPIHWGLFALAAHAWTEPIERATAEAKRVGVTLATPKPGQRFEPQWLSAENPQRATVTRRWWPQLKWQTAQEHAIKSGQVDSE